MKGKRYARATCLLLAVALKAAQRVCLPFLPDLPLTAVRLALEGVYLLLALGIGMGTASCALNLSGRAFWCLYGRSAVLSLLCRMAGLLLWQRMGSHWVIILYAAEAGILLICSWQIRRAALGGQADRQLFSPAKGNRPIRGWHWLLLLAVLLMVGWVQGLVYRRCCWFVDYSASYRRALQAMALPMAAAEGVALLVCCWLLLPGLPDRWETRRSGAALVLFLFGCVAGLGLLDGLAKPQGFLKGTSQASAIARQSLDERVQQPWYTESVVWRAERRQGDTTEDREVLRVLRLRDHQGRCVGWTLLTEPLEEETLTGQPVQLLYPYGLLLPAGDTLRLVKLADLPRQPEDPLLTAFCRAYVTDFRLFGCCAGYLAQVDPAFVQPFLERYAAADFTPQEAAAMGDIRPERIADIASRPLAP